MSRGMHPRSMVLVLAGFLVVGGVWTSRADDGWRRTSGGWERRADWPTAGGDLPPMAHVHPMLLAGLQICGSLAALLLDRTDPGRDPSHKLRARAFDRRARQG